MKPSEIVAIARETLGSPYQHQGRVNGLALDCAGVPVHVARRLGMPLEDATRYGKLPVPAEMRAGLDKHMQRRVPKAEMQIGDLVWMRSRHFHEPHHLGVVGDYIHGGLSIIHGTNGHGLNKVVEHRIDAEWLANIVAVWRFPGVET